MTAWRRPRLAQLRLRERLPRPRLPRPRARLLPRAARGTTSSRRGRMCVGSIWDGTEWQQQTPSPRPTSAAVATRRATEGATLHVAPLWRTVRAPYARVLRPSGRTGWCTPSPRCHVRQRARDRSKARRGCHEFVLILTSTPSAAPPPAPRRYAACGTLGRPAACCERTRRECVRLGHCHTHHGLRSGRRGRRGRSLIRRCHGRGGAAPDEQPRVLQGARRAGGGGDRTGGGEVPQLCAGPRQLRGDRRRAARAGESPLPPSPAALPLLAPNSLGGHRACCRLYKPF